MDRKPWYLREWRKHRGLSQEELAARVTDLTETWGERAMKLNKSDISKLERGERRYNADQLEALAAVLECDPGDLIEYTPQQADEIKRLVGRIIKRGRAVDLRLLRALASAEEDGDGSP
jgi:transcriptional regulator with XRE-family HTH domain